MQRDEPRADFGVGTRKLLGDAGGDPREIRLRGGEAHVRLETPDGAHDDAAAPALAVRRPANGAKDVGRRGPHRRAKVAWQDADDRPVVTIQQEPTSKDRPVGAESATPECVAEHDHASRARVVVSHGEQAAQGRAYAEQLEVVAGDHESRQRLRIAVAGDVRSPSLIRGHRCEGVIPIAPVGEVRRSKPLRFREAARSVIGPQLHELLGVSIRQRPEEHRAQHAEHGGVRADADREREEGDDGEAGRAAEDAGTDGEILTQLAGPIPPLSAPNG